MLITSASSKTAIGTAFLSSQRAPAGCIARRSYISTRNKDFVEGLGLYDQVFTYDELEEHQIEFSPVFGLLR